MDILYPRLPAYTIFLILATGLFGALIGGMYGALHDQISFAISREYFTKFKFQQFARADFGWPERVFVSEVGFLATWWVGLIAGWIIGRVGYGKLRKERATRCVLKAFGILIGVTALSGAIGASLGIYETSGDGIAAWDGWRNDLYLNHVREFAIVAYLHGAGYLGAVLGLVAAVGYLVRCGRVEATR